MSKSLDNENPEIVKRDIAIQSQPLIQDHTRTVDHNSIRNFKDRVEGVWRNRDHPSARIGGKGSRHRRHIGHREIGVPEAEGNETSKVSKSRRDWDRSSEGQVSKIKVPSAFCSSKNRESDFYESREQWHQISRNCDMRYPDRRVEWDTGGTSGGQVSATWKQSVLSLKFHPHRETRTQQHNNTKNSLRKWWSFMAFYSQSLDHYVTSLECEKGLFRAQLGL
jgi:hypothetical protein